MIRKEMIKRQQKQHKIMPLTHLAPLVYDCKGCFYMPVETAQVVEFNIIRRDQQTDSYIKVP